jgi:hypothetical protein
MKVRISFPIAAFVQSLFVNPESPVILDYLLKEKPVANLPLSAFTSKRPSSQPQRGSVICYFKLGQCVRAMASSGLPRSSLFVTSKVYSSAFSYHGTLSQVESSLSTNGLA